MLLLLAARSLDTLQYSTQLNTTDTCLRAPRHAVDPYTTLRRPDSLDGHTCLRAPRHAVDPYTTLRRPDSLEAHTCLRALRHAVDPYTTLRRSASLDSHTPRTLIHIQRCVASLDVPSHEEDP